MAEAKIPKLRWSIRHPLASSGLLALCCVGGGVMGELLAGGGIAHAEPFYLAAIAVPALYGSLRHQRARLIRNFS